MKPSAYSVLNSAYPGTLSTPASWPVTTDSDPAISVSGSLAAQLQIGNPFTISLEAAIQTCDRHVYVEGEPVNPPQFIQDYLNILRWEAQQLWNFDHMNVRLGLSATFHLTHEHYGRAGELLAEGIALEFLRQRLAVKRQRFFF